MRFLNESNWIALCALVLATILVIKSHPAEGSAIITGSFALLHVNRSTP